MKPMVVGLLGVLMGLGIVCSFAEDIKIGDARSAVIAVLGQPKATMKFGGQETLLYERYEVTIKGGIVNHIATKAPTSPAVPDNTETVTPQTQPASTLPSTVSPDQIPRSTAHTRPSATAPVTVAPTTPNKDAATPATDAERDQTFAKGLTYFISHIREWGSEPLVFDNGSSPSPSLAGTTDKNVIFLQVATNPAITPGRFRIRLSLPLVEGGTYTQTRPLVSAYSSGTTKDRIAVALSQSPTLRVGHYGLSARNDFFQGVWTWGLVTGSFPGGYHVKGPLTIDVVDDTDPHTPISNSLEIPITITEAPKRPGTIETEVWNIRR